MKTIQSKNQREELRSLLEKIVQDIENSRLYTGKLSVQRVLPPPGTPLSTPAGYPHLIMQEQKRKKLLGLIPYIAAETILIVKEGFYDAQGKGRKDMFIRLRSKIAEAIVKKHFSEYGSKNQVTEIIYNK